MSERYPETPDTNPPEDEDLAFALAAFGDELRDVPEEEEPLASACPANPAADALPADPLGSLQQRYGERLQDGSKFAYANAIALACSQACSQAAATAPSQQGRYLMFSIGVHQLGIPLTAVREVTDCAAFTPLPRVEPWLLGICLLRGKIVSVTDLADILKIEADPSVRNRRLVVVHSGTQQITTALVVDRLLGLRTPAIDIAVSPQAPPAWQRFLGGHASLDGKLFHLIDPDRLLGCHELSCYL